MSPKYISKISHINFRKTSNITRNTPNSHKKNNNINNQLQVNVLNYANRMGATHSKRRANSTTSPPPYNKITTSGKKTKIGIDACSVPQWTWDNAQCRSWLIEVLVKGGEDRDHAEALITPYKGFGPNLWLLDFHTWRDWLGGTGAAIYYILEDRSTKKGGVPRGLIINHYQPGWYELERNKDRQKPCMGCPGLP